MRTASVNLIRQDSWCLYADGFKRAAELLIQNVKGTYEMNTVIYPILALYRQFVELSLKEIISYGQYLDRHSMKQGGHDLKNLWAVARSYVKKHYKQFPKDRLKRIEQIIKELHELDPTSEASRYPFVRSKTPKQGQSVSFPYDAKPINLDGLAGEISELASMMKNITDILSISQDLEREFRAEYYS